MKRNIVRIPSAWLPIFMSAIVLAAMVWHLARFGLAHQADEGTAAHLFQILMPLQIPFIGYFAVRWLPADPRWAARTLAVQLGLFAGIIAVVYFFLDR